MRKIMKKIITIIIFISCIFTLAACQSREVDIENMSPRQLQQLGRTLEELNKLLEENGSLDYSGPVQVTSQSSEENIRLAEQLYRKYNRRGENYSVEINDSTTDEKIDSHQEIVIRGMERYTRNGYEEAKEAIDAGTATSSQITMIYENQLMIEEAAKELEKADDLIRLVYTDINHEDISIAVANKNGSLLPLVK